MKKADQVAICEQIAIACMWGQGGIASVILDNLDKAGPKAPLPWRQVYGDVRKSAIRRHVGVLSDREELRRLLFLGYSLCNYDEDGCSLHRPDRFGGGLHMFVSKELSDEFPRPATFTQSSLMGFSSYLNRKLSTGPTP